MRVCESEKWGLESLATTLSQTWGLVVDFSEGGGLSKKQRERTVGGGGINGTLPYRLPFSLPPPIQAPRGLR